MANTEYVVLRDSGEDGGWVPVGEASASSARAAIHHLVSRTPSLVAEAGLLRNVDEYEFVAIPVRSWQPMKVRPETTMRFKIETVIP